jgi:hypothetical protein
VPQVEDRLLEEEKLAADLARKNAVLEHKVRYRAARYSYGDGCILMAILLGAMAIS